MHKNWQVFHEEISNVFQQKYTAISSNKTRKDLFNFWQKLIQISAEENYVQFLADYSSSLRDYRDTWATFGCPCSPAGRNF